MNPRHQLNQILLIIAICVTGITSYSQVQELQSESSQLQLTEINVSETDEKPVKVLLTTEKDSISKHYPAKTKLVAEQVKSEKLKEEAEDDKSILSFNFIYYIIKKFKLSDIVD